MFLDYFSLGLLFFVALVLFYGIIAIHGSPYEIAALKAEVKALTERLQSLERPTESQG